MAKKFKVFNGDRRASQFKLDIRLKILLIAMRRRFRPDILPRNLDVRFAVRTLSPIATAKHAGRSMPDRDVVRFRDLEKPSYFVEITRSTLNKGEEKDWSQQELVFSLFAESYAMRIFVPLCRYFLQMGAPAKVFVKRFVNLITLDFLLRPCDRFRWQDILFVHGPEQVLELLQVLQSEHEGQIGDIFSLPKFKLDDLARRMRDEAVRAESAVVSETRCFTKKMRRLVLGEPDDVLRKKCVRARVLKRKKRTPGKKVGKPFAKQPPGHPLVFKPLRREFYDEEINFTQHPHNPRTRAEFWRALAELFDSVEHRPTGRSVKKIKKKLTLAQQMVRVQGLKCLSGLSRFERLKKQCKWRTDAMGALGEEVLGAYKKFNALKAPTAKPIDDTHSDVETTTREAKLKSFLAI